MKRLLIFILALALLLNSSGQILRYSNYTVGSPPASLELLTGLVSYWNIDDASAPIVDLHASYDGTLSTSAPALQEATKAGFGYCAEFVNASNQYIYTNVAVNGRTGDWSVSAWFKIASDNGTLNYVVCGNYAAGAPQWWFSVNSNMELQAYFNFAGSMEYAGQGAALSLDTWYHGVLTVDRDGYARVYLNGSPYGTNLDVSSHSAVDMYNASYSFKIGGRVTSDNWSFDGWIDEVGFWSRILTADEVSALYSDELIYADFE